MTGLVLALALGPEVSPLPASDLATAVRSLVAVFVVLGLIALCAWLLRRGAFGALGRKGPALARVEGAVALGERRSLVVVAVEGRRILLGVTPHQVSFLTELNGDAAGFAASLARATDRADAPGGGRS